MRGLDSPWGLRVTGLVGVAVVAAGAYGAGALPGRDPGAGLRGPGTPGATFWLGLAGWVIGLAILSGAWWRLGRHLGGVSSRWLLVTAALWALPLLIAPPLASRDVYSYACQGEIWRSGLDPYALGAADGGCLWAGAVPELWQHTPAPYGPVGVALSGVAAAVARAVGGPADNQLLAAVAVLRVVALIGGVLIAAYAGRLASAVGVSPVAARWLGLLSPLVAVHLVSGAHNDALTAGLTVAALAIAVPAAASGAANRATAMETPATALHGGTASRTGILGGVAHGGGVTVTAGGAPTSTNDGFERIREHSPHAPGVVTGGHDGASEGTTERRPRRMTRSDGGGAGLPVAAGALLGLAVGIKVTAIIALPFVILLVAGQRIQRGASPARTIALAAATVTVSGALVFTAASLATGLGLGWIGALSDTGSLVQWTSLPTGLGMAVGYLLRAIGQPGAVDTAVDVARVGGIAALAVIGIALCWRALQATLRLAPPTTDPAPAGGAAVTAPPPRTQLVDTANRVEDDRRTPGDPRYADPRAEAGQHRFDRTAGGTADLEPAATHRRTVVAACGWALVAAAFLLPVFYPWYALVPLAVLACATPPGRTRAALAATTIAVTALTLPNGLGIPVLTKLPGAILDVAIVGALIAYRLRNRRDDPAPAVDRR
ncbi:polyprenol phosphomannose-dependent alpha 1,6 mannosyltransferase MptB [Asanoa sp. NPDC050611]|uniref:polyprenol phosphomannose-dependent alpha 1,6 mannosyltransferase MptB n=1 Tax=Asanoa sp. NPDC050611 TaxID=3157098 RepID=UPI0033CAD0EE